MSRDDQHAMGLQAAAQVFEQMPVLPDNSPETQYVRQLGHKLVTTIPLQYSWPFEFHVVAQKEINAFALPGGPMFINIGTITKLFGRQLLIAFSMAFSRLPGGGACPPCDSSVLKNGERMSIDDATRQLIEDMQQNNGLQPVSDARPINVSGIQGRSVMLQTSSPFPSANGQQQKERDWLVTFPQRDGSVIFMVFVAPQSDFARLQPTYEAMLKSVQFR